MAKQGKFPIWRDFIELVESFDPMIDGPDEIWLFFLKVKRKWTRLRVQKYQSKFYIAWGERESFEFPCESGHMDMSEVDLKVRLWTAELRRWKQEIQKDSWSAQAKLNRRLPQTLRTGVILRKNIREVIPDWMPITRELSQKEVKALTPILERHSDEPIPSFTAEKYFDYCRLAYQANPESFKSYEGSFNQKSSGREFYKRFADGRHGGLLDIEPTSSDEFEKWYDSPKRQGCHPWEIYRGGNSTHIDLYVTLHDRGGWRVGLSAFSSTRLAEACKIALAFSRASLPFYLNDAASYLKRLRGEDYVGIVPEGSGIKYAWHGFPKEWHVADAIYFAWLIEDEKNAAARARRRRQLQNIVIWIHEPVSAWLRT